MKLYQLAQVSTKVACGPFCFVPSFLRNFQLSQRIMEFKLPFPTLKSLSCLRICLHWVEHRLGPFQNFPATDGDDYFELDSLYERCTRLILDGLQIPCLLKATLADVLRGILEQLSSWRDFSEYGLIKEVQFFYFDVFGRFDEKRTLKHFIQKKVAEENNLSSLHDWLSHAHYFWLLPEVDAIFRKMVAIASKRRRSEILMEGPQPELRHGECNLVYRFVQEDAAQYLKSIRSSECVELVDIILTRDSITVGTCAEEKFGDQRKWNIDAFKDHFDLFEPSEKDGFIEHVLNDGYFADTKNQLDILTFLKHKNCQRNWMLELGNSDFSRFFEQLLVWPFTSFFIVAFEHLAPHLTSDDYLVIFSFTVEAMPAEEQYGTVHRNLLVNYWSLLTEDKKQMCATYGVDDLKVKAPSLHDTIKTELDSLMAATDKE